MSKKAATGTVLNIYDTMDFPDYKFQEYPKWIDHPGHGKRVLVQDTIEEQQLLAAHKKPEEKAEENALIKKKTV